MSPGRKEPTTLDDADLIIACLDGDQDAWTELVQRYSRLVWSIALKSGLPEETAADVVQNVFTIVLRRLESLRETKRFSAWLITTTHRESWRVAKLVREQVSDNEIDPVDPAPSLDEVVVSWEHASIVHQALGRLGERCQQLLTMLFLHDPRPAYDTIATELGISIGSIGPIRGRCLKQLKGHLADFGVVDAGQ